jgi:hypothetical protein
MSPKTRQRAMRSFLASLLQSDFNQHEMYELAEELTFGSFGKDLGDYLREWIRIDDLGRFKETGSYSNEPDISNSLLGTALEIIGRRKLSKKMVVQIMSLASSWVKPKNLENSGTVREIVERYMFTASQAEIAKFLNILGGEPADAYVKGISRRDRAK